MLADAAAGSTPSDYVEQRMQRRGQQPLKPGKNLIAVHCKQTSGGQYIDVGLVRLVENEEGLTHDDCTAEAQGTRRRCRASNGPCALCASAVIMLSMSRVDGAAAQGRAAHGREAVRRVLGAAARDESHVTIWHNFDHVREDRPHRQLRRAAAKLEPGTYQGIFFNDSDVYKVIEGAAYILAPQPDDRSSTSISTT